MKTHHCPNTHLEELLVCSVCLCLSGNKPKVSLSLLFLTTSVCGCQKTDVFCHFKFVYVMKNNMKWTHRAAGSSRGIRGSLYIRLKCNLNANCHIDASGLWLPTGPSDGAECVFRLIASHRRLLCPGRSWGCHWQCFEGTLLKTSREWCAYLRSKMIFTWFKIVSNSIWDWSHYVEPHRRTGTLTQRTDTASDA